MLYFQYLITSDKETEAQVCKSTKKKQRRNKKFSRIVSIWYQITAVVIGRDKDLKRFKLGYIEFSF